MLKLTPYPGRTSSGSKSSKTGRIGNTFSLSGATELAERVQACWRGYTVGVRVEPIIKMDGSIDGYCVRSNLRNGLPPR